MGSPLHFLDLADFDTATLKRILAKAVTYKADRNGYRVLPHKVLAMIFDKPSTRTRVSFDVGMRQLGGETLMLPGSDMQLGRGETIEDTAKVLSRFVDGIMIRTTDHVRLTELAAHATVPVINGLTDFSHPCQIMADIMTYEEHRGSIAGKKVVWSGDSNNVLTSFVQAAARFDFQLVAAVPDALRPDEAVLAWAQREGVDFHVTSDPQSAVKNADCVVTDTFVSMGDKDAEARIAMLMPYQVNDALMAQAKSDALFLHCLPAHRGEEVTASVIDGPQSVVFDEAENRLHAQKAILAYCMGGFDD